VQEVLQQKLPLSWSVKARAPLRQNTLVDLWLPIGVLVVASAFGFYWRSQQGKLKSPSKIHNFVTKDEIGIDLASRVTIVQFSSAFCSPCKATAQIISTLTKDMDDVKFVQIKSEENLQLVEKFDIKSTPTVIFFNTHAIEVGRAVGIPTSQQVLASIAAVR
jgi:thiol-disulfide isomerase/thioredoxin